MIVDKLNTDSSMTYNLIAVLAAVLIASAIVLHWCMYKCINVLNSIARKRNYIFQTLLFLVYIFHIFRLLSAPTHQRMKYSLLYGRVRIGVLESQLSAIDFRRFLSYELIFQSISELSVNFADLSSQLSEKKTRHF